MMTVFLPEGRGSDKPTVRRVSNTSIKAMNDGNGVETRMAQVLSGEPAPAECYDAGDELEAWYREIVKNRAR